MAEHEAVGAVDYLRGGDVEQKVRRQRTAERMARLIFELAPLRRGASAGEMTEVVNDVLGEKYSTRTIRRDLQAMVAAGVAECVRENRTGRCGDATDYFRLSMPERSVTLFKGREQWRNQRAS